MLYNTETILSKPRNFVTKQDILAKVSMYQLFARYLGKFVIGRVYNSPLRDDKNPSFGLFVSAKDNQLLYKDLATGDCGDAFKLIKQLKGIQNNFELYKYIYEDMNLDSQSIDLTSKKTYSYMRKDISISRRKFNDADIKYWQSYGISTEVLKLYKVSAVSKLFINGILRDEHKSANPIYAYRIFDKFKIYKPLSDKKVNWRGNLSSLDIQGYEQLPEYGDLLIITKALKDVMVLYELGYDSIAPPSESTDIPEVVIKNITQRFKRIVVLYDKDEAGVISCRKLVKKWDFDFMFINKRYKAKDISDYVKLHGIKSASDMLKKSLKK